MYKLIFMQIDLSTKQYQLSQVVSFYKTKELYGGLSNMAAKKYPLIVNNIEIDNTEALYQACRFPDYPEIQKEIIEDKSPMGSKMRAKKYRKEFTKPDFESVKMDIMYWCLQVKLFCNPYRFGSLLELTKEKEIVEISLKDSFWGCIRDKNDINVVMGQNVLGKLLVKLREENKEIKKDNYRNYTVETLDISNFLIYNKNILPLKKRLSNT